jgi:hypothetical protein
MEQFSHRFANRLLAKHSEWHALMQWHDSYFTITVPSPGSGITQPIYVSTEAGEITVGFDRWHCHLFQFQDDDEEEESSRAVELIEQILGEEIVIVSVMNGDKWGGSSTARRSEAPKAVFADRKYKGSRITVRSWKGTYDQDIPLCT